MAEHIDRDAALQDFEHCNDQSTYWTPQRVKNLLMRQPAADVAPVVHGRWIDGLSCSACGAERPTDSPHDVIWGDECNFCYSCGAKMDGGAT